MNLDIWQFTLLVHGFGEKKKILVVTIAWLPVGTTMLMPRQLLDH